MDFIGDKNRFDSDSEFVTRQQYRAMKEQQQTDPNESANFDNPDPVPEQPLSRKKIREDKIWEDKETKRQIAENKSKRLAKRLDLLILFFTVGIIIVLLVLFFVN
ncbi:hypothetical protein [Lactobacillus sp. Sy-1]|uniref:hypothetical protein n=1 Tax=Lactobacillus sp. Sy-1 TaxID=2109645 RepID=UPI001C581008|nr:hypothetical protein [Lactobacillus sp. Sy-1]MBW1605423.1 hypothetical protein [Lactobacillus sp. Sy-1]